MITATGRAVEVIALDRAGQAEVDSLVAAVPRADLVLMVAPAGADASAITRIGEACSRARVVTTTFVIRDRAASEEDLSRTLAQVRPWSLMVVIASDASYVDDILTSFR